MHFKNFRYIKIVADEVCKKCNCTEGNTKVNCSNLQLTEIPHSLPWNLMELDLRRNKLSSLNKNSFENCFNLYYLNLRTNCISSIHPSSFRDAPITHLHLEKNILNLTSFTNILSPLNNTLTTLFIYKNHNISHRVFNNLHQLEELHVDGRLIDESGKSFSTLKSLKILRLYSDVGVIFNSTFMHFENITALSKLNLDGGGVLRVQFGAFTPLKALHSLDFSDNHGFTFHFVQRFLNSLSDDLEELILTNLISKDSLGVIQEEFFKTLSKKKKLKILKLDGNRLTYIPYNFSKYVKSLNYLDISKNRLTNVMFWPLHFFFLSNLTYINFDDQEKDSCPCDRLQNHQMPSYFEDPCKAKAIKDILPCTFPNRNKKGSWCGICPKHLKELHFSNFMKTENSTLPPVIVFGECQITAYFFRSNGLVKALGPVVIFRPVSDLLVTIDLGNNAMKCLAQDILKFSIERGLKVGKHLKLFLNKFFNYT